MYTIIHLQRCICKMSKYISVFFCKIWMTHFLPIFVILSLSTFISVSGVNILPKKVEKPRGIVSYFGPHGEEFCRFDSPQW